MQDSGFKTVGSRPLKGSELDTVNYEIEMLTYCYVHCLEQPSSSERQGYYLALEGFLLHYRVLLEFFTCRTNRRDDLLLKKMKVDGKPLDPGEIEKIEAAAKKNGEGYWEPLNKFLFHMTTTRHKKRWDWPVGEMMESLRPIIKDFQEACGIDKTFELMLDSSEGARTATVRRNSRLSLEG